MNLNEERLSRGTAGLPSTRHLAGLPIKIAAPEQAARWVCEVAAADPRAVDVHLANAYTLALAHSDGEFREVLSEATANFPDGKPLAWVTRFGSSPLMQVRGPELFTNVMDIGREFGLRHFLLGTTNETLSLLQGELERRYPGVHIVGAYSPPFRALTSEELLAQDEAIRASGAHITWVGLGTPKQDFEARRLAYSLPGVAVSVGAAFDFVAGTKREAPEWMISYGLEWVFRFATEPRRLWRRYLIGNVVFLRSVISRRGER